MKRLFSNIPREEGDSFESYSYIVFGKCYCKTYEIMRNENGVAANHDRVFDGWYVYINLPFSKNRKYLSATTFETKEGICFPKILIRIRKVAKSKYYSLSSRFGWLPEIIDADIGYRDPYLEAIKVKDKN